MSPREAHANEDARREAREHRQARKAARRALRRAKKLPPSERTPHNEGQESRTVAARAVRAVGLALECLGS